MKVSIPKLHSIKLKSGAYTENMIYPSEFNRVDKGVPVINVLEGALLSNLTGVVLMGYDQDGEEYCATSSADAATNAYMFGRGELRMKRYGD